MNEGFKRGFVKAASEFGCTVKQANDLLQQIQGSAFDNGVMGDPESLMAGAGVGGLGGAGIGGLLGAMSADPQQGQSRTKRGLGGALAGGAVGAMGGAAMSGNQGLDEYKQRVLTALYNQQGNIGQQSAETSRLLQRPGGGDQGALNDVIRMLRQQQEQVSGAQQGTANMGMLDAIKGKLGR